MMAQAAPNSMSDRLAARSRPRAHLGARYTAVVFAGLLDWLLWGRVPDRWFALGALLVCGAGILTLRLRARAAPASA